MLSSHPKPVLLWPRLPKLSPRWAAMTIAAGFRYGRGVLLCADSEITYGSELKVRGRKLFAYEFTSNGGNKAVFAFSGSVAFAKMAIQQMARALAKCPRDKMSRAGMYDTLCGQLQQFHHHHIYRHPFYQQQGGPDFSVIVGLWSFDGGLGLYESSDEALVEVCDPESLAVTGTGSTFARYVASPLITHGAMSLTDVTIAAAYAIKEAKDNVPGCGGGSELISMQADGEVSNIGWIDSSLVEEFAGPFQRAIRHLFVTTCDLQSTDEQVGERFEGMRIVIQAVREHLKKEDNKQSEGLAALLALLNRKRVRKL